MKPKDLDGSNDYLLNYTFDLSLDGHMRSNNYMDTEEHMYTDELNETDD